MKRIVVVGEDMLGARLREVIGENRFSAPSMGAKYTTRRCHDVVFAAEIIPASVHVDEQARVGGRDYKGSIRVAIPVHIGREGICISPGQVHEIRLGVVAGIHLRDGFGPVMRDADDDRFLRCRVGMFDDGNRWFSHRSKSWPKSVNDLHIAF